MFAGDPPFAYGVPSNVDPSNVDVAESAEAPSFDEVLMDEGVGVDEGAREAVGERVGEGERVDERVASGAA